MKKKVLFISIITICVLLILVIGVFVNNKPENNIVEGNNVIYLTSIDGDVLIDIENEKETLEIESKRVDMEYSDLSEDIEKLVAYDITLMRENEKYKVNDYLDVYIKIPEGYDKNNLIVYYINEKQIIEDYAVKIVEKGDVSYAKFATNHFSVYALAQIKTSEEEIVNNEIKDATNESANSDKKQDSNKNNASNNSPTNILENSKNESTVAFNIVGTWKCSSINTLYYVFNNDKTGKKVNDDMKLNETITFNFNWNVEDNKLYMTHPDGGYGYNKLIIKNNDEIDFNGGQMPCVRYNGEIPYHKYYTGDVNFKTNIINIPEGLKLSTQLNSYIYQVKVLDQSLLTNGEYIVNFDLSSCTEGTCEVMPTFTLPNNVTVTSWVMAVSFELIK